MDPITIAAWMNEVVRHTHYGNPKEAYPMDPNLFTQYAQIVHQERLEQAARGQNWDTEPSLFGRVLAVVPRAVRTLLALRITLTIHTVERRRTVTEPDICIE